MNKIRIIYKGIETLVESGNENLLEIIRKTGIPIGAPCGGKGTCKKCRVIIKGDDNQPLREVLACQHMAEGDLIFEVPAPAAAMILSESYWPDIDFAWNEKPAVQSYGIAVDIGTTTVVVYLEDLVSRKNISTRSFLNPQASYGADVISRIQSVMQKPESLQEQKTLITRSINQAIKDLAVENEIDGCAIKEMAIAGNNPMLHILLGADPSGLAIFPFNPVFVDEQELKAADLGFDFCGTADVILLPALSSYVGADIIAGMAATELTDEDKYSLYIDIGTNGEMALGNQNRILTCATAAGPAFEGAKISCGLGGVDGAIHRFSGNGYKTIGSVPPTGLCGSGLVDVIAWLLDSGKLDPSGYLENPVTILEANKTAEGLPLQLTPQDIREVQLAKGAIAAGIQTLLSEAGIEESQVERLYLAGGFGYALHVDSAARIGLFPASMKDKVIRAGNLAGLGARLAIHSGAFRERIKSIQKKAEYFELSNHPGFNEAFVMEMHYPPLTPP